MGPSDQKRTLLEAEIGRLQSEITVLDRQWNRKHWLGLVALAAIPLMIAGAQPMWIVIAVLAAPCLVATQAYLLYVRRRECHELIAQAKRDVTRVSVPSPKAASSDRAPRSDDQPRTPR